MILARALIIRLLSVSVIALIFSACKQDVDSESEVMIIAHRGFHVVFPDNTYEAFESAYKRAYKAIELDVVFSSDYIPIVLHDYALNEHTGGVGNVIDYSSEEISRLKIDNTYEIPTLDGVLSRFADKFETVFIDLKQPCPDSGLIKLADIISLRNSKDICVITCINHDIVSKLRSIDKSLILGTDGTINGFEDNLYEAINKKYKYVLTDYIELDKHLCYIAKRSNIKVIAYTANNESQITQSLGFDIDGLMTDSPDLLRQILH